MNTHKLNQSKSDGTPIGEFVQSLNAFGDCLRASKDSLSAFDDSLRTCEEDSMECEGSLPDDPFQDEMNRLLRLCESQVGTMDTSDTQQDSVQMKLRRALDRQRLFRCKASVRSAGTVHSSQTPHAVFLQDAVDADNLASVVAYFLLYGWPTKDNPLHWLLAVRTENFSYPKFCKGCGFSMPPVIRTTEEEACEEDSYLTAEHAVAHIVSFLHYQYKFGATLVDAFECFRFYTGPIPKCSANLSNMFHARDFCFARSSTGVLLTPEEYLDMQLQLNGKVFVNEKGQYDPSNEPTADKDSRRDRCVDVIKKDLAEFKTAAGIKPGASLLQPLDNFLKHMDTIPEPVDFLVLAPMTSLEKLIELGLLLTKINKIYGQFFAWDNLAPEIWTLSPKAVNILKNQYNHDCDTPATDTILKWLKESDIPAILVPTEVIKTTEQEAFFSDLNERLAKIPFEKLPPLARLWRQWNLSKNGKGQFMFDQLVVFLKYVIDILDTDESYTNGLIEMTPAYVLTPEDQTPFRWPVKVSTLRTGRGDINMFAGLTVKEEAFPCLMKLTEALLMYTPPGLVKTTLVEQISSTS